MAEPIPMRDPQPQTARPTEPGEPRPPQPRRGLRRLGLGGTGAGTALILLGFVMLPSVVLGYLGWRAIQSEKSYSLERLRASYRQFAVLAARQMEYQLHAAESRWIADLDDLVGSSGGRPSAEQLAAAAGRQPLIEGYFLLSAPGRVLYPPVAVSDEDAPSDPWVRRVQVRQHGLFARLVARGEEMEYGQGDPAAAIAAYREILSQVDNPRLQAMAESYIGRAQLKGGDFAAALSTFRHLLERYPEARDLNRMYLRFLAQYQMAVALEGLRRYPEALDALLELNRDVLRRSGAITTTQYSYYSDLIHQLSPRLLSAPGLRDPGRYAEAFRALRELNKSHISGNYFLRLLDAELSEMSLRQGRFTPEVRYLSAQAESDPFLLAYRTLPDDREIYATGILAAQIDLEQLQAQLSTAMRGLHADSAAALAILGAGGVVVIGAEAATGSLMATQSLAPPFDFWQVAVYLHDVPTAMKRMDVRRTLWLWLISLMLTSILFGGYLFILRTRRQAYLSRAQTDFVANVTHELRGPLASIRMFAELLELQMTGAPGRAPARSRENTAEYLGIIQRECDRLSRLIDGVIDFSKMERQLKRYHFEPHDLGEIVTRSVESFRPHADARGFRLQLSIEASLPAVRLDSDAIAQVLFNLLTNAMQYSREEKDIRVRVHREGPAVAVDVADRGIGIAPRDIDKVFDRFYSTWRRMDSPTQGGLGLGLTLSREIVRAHGGKISVRSDPGQGSTFTFRLPAVAEDPAGVRTSPSTDVRPLERLGS